MVVKEIAGMTGLYDTIDFLDDNSAQAIGRLDEYQKYAGAYDYAFVAFGNVELRMKWICQLEAAGYRLATIIHPSASISPSARIDAGVIIEGNAVVNTNTTIGKGCLLSIGVLVDHDSIVNEGCHLETGTVIMPNSIVPKGKVTIPNSVFQGKICSEGDSNVQTFF